MNKLPQELIEEILGHCLRSGDRCLALNLRLVCRRFDRYFKGHACRTVSLNFWRLNKEGIRRRPDLDDLQTIGTHCKALNIDLSCMRDEYESTMLQDIAGDEQLLSQLRGFTARDGTFTWPEYKNTLYGILMTCDRIQALQLSLPLPMFPVMPLQEATRAFANTFDVLASRLTDEGALPFHTLVLENLNEYILRDICLNPMDMRNIVRVMTRLRNLVITFGVRRPRDMRVDVNLILETFNLMINRARQLDSLCLRGTSRRKPRTLHLRLVTRLDFEPDEDDEDDFSGRLMTPLATHLTRLELTKLDIPAQALRFLVRQFGPTLEELYLGEVYLTLQIEDTEDNPTDTLWIGRPNQRPQDGDTWAAVLFRDGCPNLRVCRAAILGYVVTGLPILEQNHPALDRADPSGLGRTVAQRFVEVVLRYAQPDAPPDVSSLDTPAAPIAIAAPTRVVQFLPYSPSDDTRCLGDTLTPRPAGSLRVVDYDFYAYQIAVANTTSVWLNNIDTLFGPHRTAEYREIENLVIEFLDGRYLEYDFGLLRYDDDDNDDEDAEGLDSHDVIVYPAVRQILS